MLTMYTKLSSDDSMSVHAIDIRVKESKTFYNLLIQINLFINLHEMVWHAMSYANYLSTAFCESGV